MQEQLGLDKHYSNNLCGALQTSIAASPPLLSPVVSHGISIPITASLLSITASQSLENGGKSSDPLPAPSFMLEEEQVLVSCFG